MNKQTTDISIFLNQWEIYQYVVNENFMAHQQIKTHLQTYLKQQCIHAFSVLDLGCGDAAMMTDVLQDTAVSHYMGIDLSTAALALAVENTQQKSISAHFEVGDLKDFTHVIQAKTFDVIVAGFSLHHLSAEEKQTFFQQSKAALNKGGLLVLYDVVRLHDESRSTYLDRYCDQVTERWHDLTPEMMTVIEGHIRSSDYPQSLQELETMVLTAGFSTLSVGYSDPTEFHQLLYINV